MNDMSNRDPDRAQVEEIFLDAVELSADERAAMLDERCAGDGALRREVDVVDLVSTDAPAAFDALLN